MNKKQIQVQELQKHYTEKLEISDNQMAFLKEQLNDIVVQMNDAGWDTISGYSTIESAGVKLETLKLTSVILRDMTETNPLFKRGANLRFAYCYARGINFGIDKPATKLVMTNAFNKEALFCNQAFENGIKTRFCDGNRFILRKDAPQGKADYYIVPLSQITEALVDPNDLSRIRYIKRNWTANAVAQEAWYPTYQLRNSNEKVVKSIVDKDGNKHKVETDYTMFHKAYNRPTGQTWGLPDSLAAMLWAKAYSAYLKDNASLVKAFSRIAIKISASTTTGATNASARVAANSGIGGTAVHGKDVDISAMPTSGSNVDFNNGRPLAAMVAASFGVSIVALLADPGTGGSYGVAETLDPPTLLMAQGLQTDEKELYEDILRSTRGETTAKVGFPMIETDPTYRSTQSICQVVSQGLLWPEEGRAALLKMHDIEEPKIGLAPPSMYNLPGQTQLAQKAAKDAQDTAAKTQVAAAKAAPKDPIARQGNSGVVGKGIGTNNDSRDAGEYE